MDLTPEGWAALLTPAGGVIIPLFLLFFALQRGWLVTRREVDRLTQQWERERDALIDQWNDRLSESHQREQQWRETALTSEETRRDVADQLRATQSFGEVIVQALSAGKVTEKS